MDSHPPSRDGERRVRRNWTRRHLPAGQYI